MASGSILERYFRHLPGRDGCGSSSSARVGSSIASSMVDGDAKKRALHNVCPAPKKRKLPQPRGKLQRCSNPVVKLLTPPMDVQIITGADDEGQGGEVPNDVRVDVTNISTTKEAILLESAEDEPNEDDDDFQEEPPKKAARRTYDSQRKFQLSWVGRCPWAEAMDISGVTMVKCTMCSTSTGKPVMLALKIAILQWHEGNYTAEKDMAGGIKKGDKFVYSNCRHLRNERTLATRGVQLKKRSKTFKERRHESSSKWTSFFTFSA
jgi:hypothetical protein